MMDLYRFRMPVVAVGLLVGMANALDFLPVVIQEWQDLVVTGILAFTLYVWWTEYHVRAVRANALVSRGFHRTPFHDNNRSGNQAFSKPLSNESVVPRPPDGFQSGGLPKQPIAPKSVALEEAFERR